MATRPARGGFWAKAHHLDKMSFRELVVAYAQYPAILLYLGLAAIGAWLAITHMAPLPRMLAAIAAAILLFPLAWYGLHRFVLHSRWMWRHRLLAATWKRIHYDHHQDPNHLEVLFGSPGNVIPTVAAVTIPIGWAIGGPGAAAAAFATGMITTCVNEFFHCIQHLSYKPKNRWAAAIKARHMAHHFHDETGNFGITNFGWDKLFGSFYERADRPAKSATVFNLGYTEDVARRWPHLARLSGGVADGHPRRRG